MALSYTLSRAGLPQEDNRGSRRRVLVTGAAGNIGSYFAEHSSGRYSLRLMLREGDEPEDLEKYGELVTGDLGDLD